MKLSRILLLGLVFLGLLRQDIFASDWELWNKYTITKNLTEKVDFKVEPELRFKSEFGHFYFEQTYVGPVFKITKWLKISFLYDYKESEQKKKKKETKDIWKHEDMGIFDVELKLPFLLSSNFNYRSRTEYNFTKNGWVQRNNFKVSKECKKIKGLSFFVGDEIFYNFVSDTLDENRTFVGFSKKINDNLSWGLSYILRYRKSTYWYSANILQLEMGISF